MSNRIKALAFMAITISVMVQISGCRKTTPVSETSVDTHLPSEQTIDTIEPVFEFYDAMPTGITVSKNGRKFVNYPCWGDNVPFTVGEIRGDKVVAYPDRGINTFDSALPGRDPEQCPECCSRS